MRFAQPIPTLLALLLWQSIGATVLAATAVPPDPSAELCEHAAFRLEASSNQPVRTESLQAAREAIRSRLYLGKAADPRPLENSLAYEELYGYPPQVSFDRRIEALTDRSEKVIFLGKGGEANVYEVTDKTGRVAIVKVAKNDEYGLLRDNFWSTKLREAYATHAPHSSNPFLQSSYYPDYRHMEMEGAKRSLDMALGDFGPANLDRSLDVIAEMGKAVSFANSQGIVHRDIKPANFLEMPDGRIVLSDFGAATRVGTWPSTLEIGWYSGTPGFRTKNQQGGKVPDFGMDAFAYRMTAIQIATGLVLQSRTLERQGIVEGRTYDHTNQHYMSFTKSPHSLNPQVPKAVSAALWHPDPLAERVAERVEKARAYAAPEKEQEYFEKIFSPEFEDAILKDPRRSAAEFLSSSELMEVAEKGWLKLSKKAKERLWEQCASLYDFYPLDAYLNPEYPPRLIENEPLKARLRAWSEYHGQWVPRRFLRRTLGTAPLSPF